MKRFNFFVLMLLFCQMAFSAEIVKLTDEASIDKVIKEMTLEEKAKLVCGMGMTSKKVPGAVGSTYEIPRLGIPELVVSDGPAGLRLGGTFSGVKAVYATAFPIPAAMASSWP